MNLSFLIFNHWNIQNDSFIYVRRYGALHPKKKHFNSVAWHLKKNNVPLWKIGSKIAFCKRNSFNSDEYGKTSCWCWTTVFCYMIAGKKWQQSPFNSSSEKYWMILLELNKYPRKILNSTLEPNKHTRKILIDTSKP